jgi:endonuclease I
MLRIQNLITLLLVLFINFSFSQVPSGYYDAANGSGYQLKTQLYNIIKNNTVMSYNTLWNLYSDNAYRDNYYEYDGSLLDMYSENVDGTDAYNYTSTTQQCGSTTTTYEGLCYNREHLVPESFFEQYFQSIGVNTNINSVAYYVKNDAHFITPTDIKVNAWRGNLPFGRLYATNLNPCDDTASNKPCYSSNNSKIGFNNNSGYSAGYTNNVFEPLDEFKGDIARSILYFVTRYENILPQMYSNCTNTTAKAMFDGTADHSFNNTFLKILLTWHLNDPVSDREIAINNRIFTYQNNRNPFIDNPEFACMIWSSQCATLSNENFISLDNNIVVSPNPSNNNKINIQSSVNIANIQVITINGQLIMEIKNPETINNSYIVENIPSGFYFLKITSQNQTITKKVIVN